MSGVYFARAGRVSVGDLSQRSPELAPLRSATISVFGLGCLGAPSTLELARSGTRELRVLDPDFVDPATVGRWPFGLQSAGLPKAAVIAQAIERDYPSTAVKGFIFRLGAVRQNAMHNLSDSAVMQEMTAGTSLLFDATAEVGIQQYLADVAAELLVPYVGVDATPGGWGGHVVRIIPSQTMGCWLCYRHRLMDGSIGSAPAHPSGEVQPPGCGDLTFTGAGFDLVQVALMAVRMAVSTICEGNADAYPTADWDVTTIALRREDGKLIPPQFSGYRLERHPDCPHCMAR